MLHLLKNHEFFESVTLSVAVMLFAGFLVTRITKKLKMPNVTGYIFAGILIGPYALNLIPQRIVSGMSFLTDAALAFIAFGAGRYFKISSLKEHGVRTLVITAFEAMTAAALIALAMIYGFRLPAAFSILLGSIGCATAPASTLMTIRQYHAKGDFVNTIIEVVALDDAIALIAFSISAAVATNLNDGGAFSLDVAVKPVLLNFAAIALGVLFGALLNLFINENRSYDHRLVLAIASIFSLTGFCTAVDISPLLACMAFGAAYVNISGNQDLFRSVNGFTPPILLMFFVLSGMSLDLPSLKVAGVIGIGYFLIRIIGKSLGAYVGASLVHAPAATRKYLGLALIPQAGVSIGLAALGQRILPENLGTLLSTIILSSAVLYELIGPASAKASLFLSGTIAAGSVPGRAAAPESDG